MRHFFAEYVGRIRIWCIFIARRYASTIYAVVVCPSAWCGCSVMAATVGIVELTDAAGESILCHKGWRRSSSQMTLGSTC